MRGRTFQSALTLKRGSLKGRWWFGVSGAECLCGTESPNHQWRGTKWSVAGEVVWRDGDGGLWRHKGWETLGSQTPTKTDIVRLADLLPGLGRDGPKE